MDSADKLTTKELLEITLDSVNQLFFDKDELAEKLPATKDFLYVWSRVNTIRHCVIKVLERVEKSENRGVI